MPQLALALAAKHQAPPKTSALPKADLSGRKRVATGVCNDNIGYVNAIADETDESLLLSP